MNSLFNTKTAIGMNYTDNKNRDRSLVIDIDDENDTCTVYRAGLKPFPACLPKNIPEFVAEMIGCPESTVMAEFKDFVDAIASAIHK
jgi:hypothetical protein